MIRKRVLLFVSLCAGTAIITLISILLVLRALRASRKLQQSSGAAAVAAFKRSLHTRLERVIKRRWKRLTVNLRTNWRDNLDAIVMRIVQERVELGQERSPDPATEAVVLLLLDEMEALARENLIGTPSRSSSDPVDSDSIPSSPLGVVSPSASP